MNSFLICLALMLIGVMATLIGVWIALKILEVD